jgi:3-phenylpropionate/trans-cinnamate dioxygenase ferredoxin reductase subunit
VSDDGDPPRRVVIVGAGQAGGTAAKALRGEGFDGEIVLVGDEIHRPYERPPLSKAVLVGEATPDSTLIMRDETFDDLRLDFRPGTIASAIDRQAREVAFADGTSVGYDRLVLATGGRARRLDIPGADLPGIFVLRTREDSLEIGQALGDAGHALVVGGGWIGLEIAAAARKLDVDVMLIEALDRLCERASPPILSAYLYDLHRHRGVDLRLRRGIERIEATEGGLRATLSGGDIVDTDLVVVGIGLLANDELARAAGLDCDRGILVDPCGRTGDPRVFAVGDVAVFNHPWLGRPMRLESWANARDQGAACAKAIVGTDAAYDEIPWFWSDQYEKNIQILGVPENAADPVVRGDPAEDRFSCFYVDDDGKLQAAIAVDSPTDFKVAQRLARTGRAVDLSQLADPAINLRSLLKG